MHGRTSASYSIFFLASSSALSVSATGHGSEHICVYSCVMMIEGSVRFVYRRLCVSVCAVGGRLCHS